MIRNTYYRIGADTFDAIERKATLTQIMNVKPGDSCIRFTHFKKQQREREKFTCKMLASEKTYTDYYMIQDGPTECWIYFRAI